jgi:hypothetical protein
MCMCVWLVHRFVGMLPQEQLQTYLVRAVTGVGARVQPSEDSEEQFAEASQKLSLLAGTGNGSSCSNMLYADCIFGYVQTLSFSI